MGFVNRSHEAEHNQCKRSLESYMRTARARSCIEPAPPELVGPHRPPSSSAWHPS